MSDLKQESYERMAGDGELQRALVRQAETEAALRESEARFRGAFDNAMIGMALVGVDGRWIQVNPALCGIVGYDEAELLAGSFQDITHPDDLHADLELLRETLDGRRPGYRMEKRYLHKKGHVVWGRLAVSLVRDDDGQPLHFVSQIEDITEYRQTVDKLRESRERFSAIFNQTFQFIGFLDPAGVLLEVNETALQFGGFLREHVVGRRFWDCPWWRASDQARQQLRAAIQRAAQGEFVRYQVEVSGSGDKRAIIDFSLKPMRDGSGRVKYLIPEGRDVTELRAAEAESERQRELLRAVLENLAEGVVACDAQGELMLFNKAAREWHGTDVLKVPQAQWAESFDLLESDGETHLPPEAIPLVRAFQGERVRDAEIAIAARDQPTRFVVTSGDAVYAESGEQLGAVAVMHDVTERRRRAEQLEDLVEERTRDLEQAKAEAERANEAKSRFLSRMSHELRTPLNGILGFAQLLEMAGLPQRHHRSVGRILGAGRHLLDLINEVLDISRVESGVLALSCEPVELSGILEEAIEVLQPLAEARNIRLSGNRTARNQFVIADPQRLKQVFLNLLSNAVKYNHEGGQVSFVTERTADGRLRLGVRDTGGGIPKGDQEKLFIPFERLGAERKGIEGTGLGLSLSRGLVQAMKGALTVESIVGEGSAFWVELPIAQGNVERADPAETARAAPIPASSGITAKVLYIEDNADNLSLVEQVLVHRPHIRLISAIQGSLGVQMAIDHQPDLVFLDLHLPDLNGDQVIQNLKNDERTAGIPVIMLTADAMLGREKELLALGARQYLTKPIDVPRLLEVLDAYCSANGR